MYNYDPNFFLKIAFCKRNILRVKSKKNYMLRALRFARQVFLHTFNTANTQFEAFDTQQKGGPHDNGGGGRKNMFRIKKEHP